MRALKSLFNVFIIISVIVCAVPSINCSAESDKPAAAADVSVLSKYVWRGFELSNDSLVVQPSLTVSYKGVGINLWGNLDTEFDDRDPATSDESSLNETDLTVSYDRTFGSFSLGAGYIYYALDGLSDSQEVYASLGLDTLLAPTVKIYREIAHTPAWYVSLGISHSFALPKNMTLDLGASAGYYYSDDDSFVEVDDSYNPTADKYRALHDGLLTASLTIPLNEYMAVAPMLAYSFTLSDEAENLIASSAYDGDSEFFYGGVTFSVAF